MIKNTERERRTNRERVCVFMYVYTPVLKVDNLDIIRLACDSFKRTILCYVFYVYVPSLRFVLQRGCWRLVSRCGWTACPRNRPSLQRSENKSLSQMNANHVENSHIAFWLFLTRTYITHIRIYCIVNVSKRGYHTRAIASGGAEGAAPPPEGLLPHTNFYRIHYWRQVWTQWY